LGNRLDVVTLEDDLVLDFGKGDSDTGCHAAFSDNLLSHYWSAPFPIPQVEQQRTEVSDLEVGSIIVGDGVDGEMGVDQSHLVQESLCDTNDHVLDEGLDGS
jgi:hypothetical protein